MLFDHFRLGAGAGAGALTTLYRVPFGPITLLNRLSTGSFLLTRWQFDLIDVNRRSSLFQKEAQLQNNFRPDSAPSPINVTLRPSPQSQNLIHFRRLSNTKCFKPTLTPRRNRLILLHAVEGKGKTTTPPSTRDGHHGSSPLSTLSIS